MTDRVSSGQRGVDLVLGGGVPAGGISLIVGRPGAGKTILAQQFLFHNATPERPGVYLSTVSEPLEKMVRYGQGFEFFEPAALGSSVFYEDLGESIARGGLGAVLEKTDDILRRRRPAVLVVDSFKALHDLEEDARAFREFLYQLAGRLSAFPVASFWVGENAPEDISRLPEFAVADTILELGDRYAGSRSYRSLRVMKLRGSGFLSGDHAYRIVTGGLEVFPRLADPLMYGETPRPAEDVLTGVRGLDAMLGEGFPAGSSTLVAGPSGIGKTILGLHFLFSGGANGGAGLMANFQENQVQLARTASAFGWSFDGNDRILMHRSPVDLLVDEWVYDLLRTVDRLGARRVVIDSLGDVRQAAGDDLGFREYVYSLLQRLHRLGVNVLMTLEMPELFGITRLPDVGVSHLSDNVLLMRYTSLDGDIGRRISVLKSRGSAHDLNGRPFTIGPKGLEIES